MKNKISPNNNEVPVQDGEMLVSKTDLTGRITYANRAFMRTANYSERQLLGVQHNIVRHPDMPRGVFQLLWDTLKGEREFFGYVKNLTADGDYYWVFANITPDRDLGGKVSGYFSVRKTIRPEALATIVPLYREMLAEERRVGPAAAVRASLALLQAKIDALHTDYERFVLALQNPQAGGEHD